MPAQVVVAAAIVDSTGGWPRVLAACRAAPAELAGWWEFPGGKVELGETDEAALVRECREELGVEVVPLARLGGDLPSAGGGVLRVWTARLERGRPCPLEHREVRWLSAEELSDVEWLPQDVALLAALRPLLERQ